MIIIRNLGLADYQDVWQKMKFFTENRTKNTIDELWLLEHHPVYTQGQAGKDEHILKKNNIPVVHSDRGGQVTYHGPGQLISYILFDLKRNNLNIKKVVCFLEEVIIKLINQYGIVGHRLCGAPGVYVQNKKIASIGLRIKNGCTYHGTALNINMDLIPFTHINPCGISELKMTQLSDFYPSISILNLQKNFTQIFLTQFN